MNLCYRTGMTAVELLVAMALAGMLMISVLGVLSRLSTTRTYLRDHKPPRSWQTQLHCLLQSDFANSTQMELRADEVTFEGHNAAHFETGLLTLERARVTYLIRPESNEHWMVRRSFHVDAQPGDRYRMELVLAGATEFDVQTYEPVRDRWVSELRSRMSRKRIDTPALCRLRILGNGESVLLDCILVREGVAE